MDDWWLKIQRAEKHMIDIKEEARRYASSNPYTIKSIRLPDSDNEIGFRFHITKQPDPIIAVMVGDFIHNLRSALDYIIVASVPKQYRHNARFPIECENIFARDKNRKFMIRGADGRNRRRSFRLAIRGLSPKARAFIIALQPYQERYDISLAILGIINRLENADKHRQLAAIGGIVRNASMTFTVNGVDKPLTRSLCDSGHFLKDNAVISYPIPHEIISSIKPSDMKVHFTGEVTVFVKITDIGRNKPAINMSINEIVDMALWSVKKTLKWLERLVIR